MKIHTFFQNIGILREITNYKDEKYTLLIIYSL